MPVGLLKTFDRIIITISLTCFISTCYFAFSFSPDTTLFILKSLTRSSERYVENYTVQAAMQATNVLQCLRRCKHFPIISRIYLRVRG